jgi:hypothetical protein
MNTQDIRETIEAFISDYQNSDDNWLKLRESVVSLVDSQILQARLQMKVNIWQQFKTQMDLQSLSTPPTDGSRFRTPLEELTIILENQVPLAELEALLTKQQEGK